MAEVKSVTPEQVQTLLEQGYVYVDVRSEPEFEEAHIPGALNVPLMHLGPSGMQPNPDFVSVMTSAFGKDEKLVVGCKAGPRSRRAAMLLIQNGFEDVSEMQGGFVAGRDAFGRLLPGWTHKGLPTEAGRKAGQAYDDVKRRSPA